jgi:hypothetical protein
MWVRNMSAHCGRRADKDKSPGTVDWAKATLPTERELTEVQWTLEGWLGPAPKLDASAAAKALFKKTRDRSTRQTTAFRTIYGILLRLCSDTPIAISE